MKIAQMGRVYMDYRWEVKDEECYYTASFPEDYVLVETPHLVPNGKWVMERPHGWAWLVGVQFEELEKVEYLDKDGLRHRLYSCDKPFGYVTALEAEYIAGKVYRVPVGRRYLVCAQQIHKGELGQTVPFNRIPYVRAKDKKQGNGWVRLSDLIAASGLSSEEIILGYWNHTSGRVFDIVRVDSAEDIKGLVPLVHSLTETEMRDNLSDWLASGEPYDTIMVRRGFAYTVLRLLALGVRPELHQFA